MGFGGASVLGGLGVVGAGVMTYVSGTVGAGVGTLEGGSEAFGGLDVVGAGVGGASVLGTVGAGAGTLEGGIVAFGGLGVDGAGVTTVSVGVGTFEGLGVVGAGVISTHVGVGAGVFSHPGIGGQGVELVVGAGVGSSCVSGVVGAGVETTFGWPKTQPHAPALIRAQVASTGATQVELAPVQLGSVSMQSCTATSPFRGHEAPAGAPPDPLQTGPLMQYVASPSTETFVQDFEVEGAGVGLSAGC